MKKLPLIIYILSITAVCAYSQGTKIKLTNHDRREIIQSILSEANFESSKDAYLLTGGLPPSYIPRVPGINLVLINRQQLADKLKLNNSLFYYKFRRFETKGRLVIVDFGHYNGGNGYYSGSGGTWKFHKVRKKWKGRASTGWAEGT